MDRWHFLKLMVLSLGLLTIGLLGGFAPSEENSMETVLTNDGTPIAYQRSGTGPALVLVHGTSANHTVWTQVLPALEQHFSVYALDRRGRGASGDAETYTIEHEADDIAAVIDAIGEPVHLLGHSYGAIIALETALPEYRQNDSL